MLSIKQRATNRTVYWINKNICLYSSLIFVFCKRIYPLPPKMKELASITRSTFSAVDFHSTDHILAAVGFCCYYWNAVWICLSVKASTRSFERRVKRIEISKYVPRLAHLFLFTKSAFKIFRWMFWQPTFRNFRTEEAAFSSLLYTFNANSSTLSYCCSDSNCVKLSYLSSRQGEPSGEEQGQSEIKRLYSQAKQTKTHIKRRFMGVFNIPEENWKERARLKANKW